MAVNPHSEPKMEQIITEFFAKSLHIILESRCPYVSSRNYSGDQILHSPSSSMRSRDKWFNLALRDCPAAIENVDFWRQSNLEPMVVDVVLVQRPQNWEEYVNSSSRVSLERNLSSKDRLPFLWRSDSYQFGCDGNTEKIIERWVVQYESRKGRKEVCPGSKRSSSTTSQALYKKAILLLRSLYVTVRLLPAYKIFHELSSGRIRTFSLFHRVSSSVEAIVGRDEAEMQQFMFTPVDTSCGKLCLSLLYLPSISDATSESSTPMSLQFIPDYVDSPSAVGKLLSLQEDIARESGVKTTSNSSPHKSFFRTCSRLSFEDSYDDSEFSGHFVVDDDCMMDPGCRPGSSDGSGNPNERKVPFLPRKSQDAAVGALVQMLKKAPPLQQDLPEGSYNHVEAASSSLDSSWVPVGKTTSEALEELKAYKDMKQLLLRQSGKS